MPREQPCTGELSLSLALLHSFTLTLNINLVLPRTQPRYVLLVGRMSCGGGAVINVEIQLHVKRLFELKKRLSTLYEGRAALGAETDEVTLAYTKLIPEQTPELTHLSSLEPLTTAHSHRRQESPPHPSPNNL